MKVYFEKFILEIYTAETVFLFTMCVNLNTFGSNRTVDVFCTLWNPYTNWNLTQENRERMRWKRKRLHLCLNNQSCQYRLRKKMYGWYTANILFPNQTYSALVISLITATRILLLWKRMHSIGKLILDGNRLNWTG